MAQDRRSLRDRVDDDLLSLGALASEDAMRARSRAIRDAYPVPLLLHGLVAHLDTRNGQLRGGLGLLAQLLPRDQTEKALLQVVLNKQLPSTARLSAVTILQDYLERPVQSQFVADIADTDAVVLASMREAFAARARYPGVLIEYIRQFARLDRSHRAYVLGLLPQVRPEDAAALLRFMAYHRTDGVAGVALERLGAMAHREAERALYILSQTLYLDPEAMQTARTLLRRKRFQGASLFTPPPVPDAAHALPLGFTPQGGLLVQLAIPAASFHGLLEYDGHAGIRNMQRMSTTPNDPATGGSGPQAWLQGAQDMAAAADPDGTRFAFFRWHLAFTLALVTDMPPDQSYPEDFQILAPRLWQWQPADAPSALRQPFEAEDGPSVTEPDALVAELARRDLIQALPHSARAWLAAWRDPPAGDLSAAAVDSSAPMYRYLLWWLQTASALRLQTEDPTGSALLAQAARLLTADPQVAPVLFRAIRDRLDAGFPRRER